MDLATAFSQLNGLGIIAAAMAAFVVGGIWYGPLFGRAWMSEFGFTEDSLEGRNQAKIFGGTFLLNCVMAFNLAMYMGPGVDVVFGLMAGLFSGLGFVAALLGVFYLFEGRSARLFFINGGFAVVSFTAIGGTLAAIG